jgi:hypothetical protein
MNLRDRRRTKLLQATTLLRYGYVDCQKRAEQCVEPFRFYFCEKVWTEAWKVHIRKVMMTVQVMISSHRPHNKLLLQLDDRGKFVKRLGRRLEVILRLGTQLETLHQTQVLMMRTINLIIVVVCI